MYSSACRFILQPQFFLNVAEHTLCQELSPCQVSGFKVLPFLSYSLLLSFCVSPSHCTQNFLFNVENYIFPPICNLKHLKRFCSKFIFKRNNESQCWQRKQCEKLQLRKFKNIMGICKGGGKWKSLQPVLTGVV